MTAATTSSTIPKVSFVVPCYKLAHLLPECVNSILSQTFQNFEVLIMDDCSPDNTPEVAQSFRDPRIQHIRNQPNLGHLKNYNKGIEMARGNYVWLISADDVLRSPFILERYVSAADKHPEVGYAFCPSVGLVDGKETGVEGFTTHGDSDVIFPGRKFLLRLLNSNSVPAASGMVRKVVYDKLGMFPLDMPFAGDWYLWALFALYYDVAYFAEPMVAYRAHAGSMTNHLKRTDATRLVADDFAVLWRIKKQAAAKGEGSLAKPCENAIVKRYVEFILREAHGLADYRMTLEECQESIRQNAGGPAQEKRVFGRVVAGVADEYYWQGKMAEALPLQKKALGIYPWMPKIWAKHGLLRLGGGNSMRHSLQTLRRALMGTKSGS